jgi:hypothetical protein
MLPAVECVRVLQRIRGVLRISIAQATARIAHESARCGGTVPVPAAQTCRRFAIPADVFARLSLARPLH